MAAVAAIMRAHPRSRTAAGIFASMQRDTGDLPGAIATLEDLVRRDVADQSVMLVLAGYLQEAGAFERSAGLLAAVIAAHPDYAEAYNSLGVVYSRQGRHADARAAFRKVLELDPTSAKAYENLGVDEFAAGDLDAAGRGSDPRAGARSAAWPAPTTRWRRSTCVRAAQADAIAAWKTAVRLDPRLFDALYNLGMALDRGRPAGRGAAVSRAIRQRGAAGPLWAGHREAPAAAGPLIEGGRACASLR